MEKLTDEKREELYKEMVRVGFIDDTFTKIVKVFTAEEWFGSEEAEEYYKCYENVLATDKYSYEKTKDEFESVAFYLLDNGKVYRYHEYEGLKRMSEVTVGCSCIHNGGYDEVLLMMDVAMKIIPRGWDTCDSNIEIIKKSNSIVIR